MTTLFTSSSPRRISFAAILGLIVCVASSSAQLSWSAIGGAGYEHAWIDGDFTGIDNYWSFDEPTTGDVAVAAVGVWAREEGDGMLGLLARVNGSRLTTEFTWDSPEYSILLPGDTIVTVRNLNRFPLTLTSVEYELLGTVKPTELIGFGLGGSLGYRTASNFESTQSLPENVRNAQWTNPERHPVRDNGRTLVLDSGTIPQNRFSAAAVLSVLGEIRLGRSTSLVPELRLRYDLTSPFEGAGWSRVGLAGMLSLRVALDAAGRTRPGLGDVPLAPPSVSLYAIGDDGARHDRLSVRTTRAEVTRTTAVLPLIAITRAGALRLRPARTPADARAMLDSILRLDDRAMSDDVAGMVGLVLRAHPNGRARLSIVQSNALRSTARRSVDSLRTEILNRFALDPSQLIVEDVALEGVAFDSSGGDMLVAVSLDPPSLGVIESKWIEQGFAAQAVKVEPSVSSGAWQVILARGATAFDTLRGDGLEPVSLRLRIPFTRQGTQQPIVARLLTHGSETTSDTLAIDVVAEPIERRRTMIDVPGAQERAIADAHAATVDVNGRSSIANVDVRSAIAHIGEHDRVVITGADADSIGKTIRSALGSRTNIVETKPEHSSIAQSYAAWASPAATMLRERTRIVIESSEEPALRR